MCKHSLYVLALICLFVCFRSRAAVFFSPAGLMGGPHLQPLSRSSFHRLKLTLHWRQQMRNVRLIRAECELTYQVGSALPAVRCVRMVWSQEEKWDPGFYEQTAPPPTSGAVLVGLAVLCLSGLIGLTCSLHTNTHLPQPAPPLPPIKAYLVVYVSSTWV